MKTRAVAGFSVIGAVSLFSMTGGCNQLRQAGQARGTVSTKAGGHYRH